MNLSLPLMLLVLLSGAAPVAAAADGKALYQATCIACHGPQGRGAIPGVPDLAKDGRMAQSDAVLAARIREGFQSKGSPMAMPPKGGNPALTAADIDALVVYLRALTGVAARSDAGASAMPTPAPVPATAVVPPAAPPDGAFARGAKAWGANCARCHGMRDPKEFSDAQWKVVTTHMRLRAGLDGRDVRDITAFLQGSN